MRKLLLVAVIVASFGTRISDPIQHLRPDPPPPGFAVADHRSKEPELAGSALLIPLDGDSALLRITAPENGVSFDLDADGRSEQVAWPEKGSPIAFLAYDVNGDGRITSGRELFGAATRPDSRNACDALVLTFHQAEATRSGSIHHGHGLYDRLLLWLDRNHDGISQPSELRPVRETLVAIRLGFAPQHWVDAHGNQVRMTGWTQVRTAGPDQSLAEGPDEERRRRRRSFEVGFRATR
jgi:hypothetical protein